WPVALGRRAVAHEEDTLAVLPEDRLAVGQPTQEGRAGIAVTIVDRSLPEKARGIRLFGGDRESPNPAAIAVIIAHEHQAALYTPTQTGEAVLNARDFARLPLRRHDCRHQPIAVR